MISRIFGTLFALAWQLAPGAAMARNVYVGNDFGMRGATPNQFVNYLEKIIKQGDALTIYNGACNSMCTAHLVNHRACSLPGASWAFHEMTDPRTGMRNGMVTAFMFGSYPAPLKAYLGSLGPQVITIGRDEMAALGAVPKC